MNNKKVIFMTALAMTCAPLAAQDMASRYDLPNWTKDMSIGVSFVNDSMDFENSNLKNIDSQGVVAEVANRYNLGNNFWTESALRLKLTHSSDEFTEVDNKSVGLMQRISKSYAVSNMYLTPSLGLGLNYGGVELGLADDPNDVNYISYLAEVRVKLDTMKGYAPYVSYSYEIADLEDTSSELDIHSVSAGLSLVF